MSYTTEEEPDLLNLNTYGWAEWTVFTTVLLIFGLICFGTGMCYHKWRMRNHILTDDDIEDRGDDDNKIRFRATFRRFTQMLSPKASSTAPKKFHSEPGGLFSPTLKSKPAGWNQDQINRHLGKSVINSPPNINIAEDGKVSFMTLNGSELPEEEDEYGKTRAKAPMISMTESQIAKLVGRSVTKVPSMDPGQTSKVFDTDKKRKDSDLKEESEDDEDGDNDDDEENGDDQVKINMDQLKDEDGDEEMNKIRNGNMSMTEQIDRRETGNAEPDTEQNAQQPPRAFGYGFSTDQGQKNPGAGGGNIMDDLAAPSHAMSGAGPGHRALPSINQYGNNPIINLDDDVHTGFGSIN